MMKKKRRERWHNEHALGRVKEALKDKMLVNMSVGKELENRPSRQIKLAISVTVVRDCDLRATLEEKAMSCNEHSGWTCFVNRASTLLHVLPKEGDFHIRIPLYFSVKMMSDKAIERMVQQISSGRLR